MLFCEIKTEAPEMASSVVRSLTVMVWACALKALAMVSTAHRKMRFIVNVICESLTFLKNANHDSCGKLFHKVLLKVLRKIPLAEPCETSGRASFKELGGVRLDERAEMK